ncbi:probable carboxylesterase 8 [Aristolochia californica]|uniref:probable carboxylesterase 8 n=1 Tax=Aristolochia californica TaxID=171875 RepID=UPI0035E31FE2
MEEYGSVKKTSSPKDPYKLLRIIRNPDGSLTREAVMPVVPPGGDDDQLCISKDVPLNKTHGTWFRMYRPRNAATGAKLPVIIDFHGGGFIVFSAATAPFDASHRRIASEVPAIVLSVEYRLAPEHPLPAAYEDAMEALKWVRDNHANDEWLCHHADVSRCFIKGSSAGGNIAYHAALECCCFSDGLHPVNIAGVILNQPYFGGEERTESELRLEEDKILPLPANDLMWELALPRGANRDHEYCNPLKAETERRLERLPRCLMRGYSGDPLLDRQKELVKKMQNDGVNVVAHFRDGFHGIEIFDPNQAQQLVVDVKGFVLASPSSPSCSL